MLIALCLFSGSRFRFRFVSFSYGDQLSCPIPIKLLDVADLVYNLLDGKRSVDPVLDLPLLLLLDHGDGELDRVVRQVDADDVAHQPLRVFRARLDELLNLRKGYRFGRKNECELLSGEGLFLPRARQ